MLRAGLEPDEPGEVASFDDLRWLLAQGALQGRDVRLVIAGASGSTTRDVVLPFEQDRASEMDADLFRTHRHRRSVDPAGDG